MLRKYCPWFRRTSKRRDKVADMDNNPPPYVDNQTQTSEPTTTSRISPHSNAIISNESLAHNLPSEATISNARLACTLSAEAITVRALADYPEPAVAMAKTLERINITVKTILAARGIPSDTLAADITWGAVLTCTTRKAREVANQLHKVDFAMAEAARLEGLLASGGADAMAIQYYRRNGISPVT